MSLDQTPASEPVGASWSSIRAHLESLRRDILAEIQHYPTPIPHCDQQFNWLLARRDQVAADLYALDTLKDRASEAPSWDSAQQRLEAARQRILSEIQRYPTPIPHCDQQFNWLLEQRDRVSADLYRLEALRDQAHAALDALVQESPFLGAAS